MKRVLFTLGIFFLAVSSLWGIVTVTLDGSGSTDIDGYIAKWVWYRWDDATQKLYAEGHVTWSPNEPTDYYVYDDTGTITDVRSKATFDVELPVGVYYFALAVEDNDGGKSTITMANRLIDNPNDEWVKITVLPANKPPIILAKYDLWDDVVFESQPQKISLSPARL